MSLVVLLLLLPITQWSGNAEWLFVSGLHGPVVTRLHGDESHISRVTRALLCHLRHLLCHLMLLLLVASVLKVGLIVCGRGEVGKHLMTWRADGISFQRLGIDSDLMDWGGRFIDGRPKDGLVVCEEHRD